MRTEDALRRLDEHQARILAHVDTARGLLSGGPQVANEELARLRWTLSRLLREYQLFKHGEIFDPAIARGAPAHATIARRMKAECVAAGNDYAAHVARWSACDVAGQWDRYRCAMLAMAQDLHAHLAREKRDVGRLLAGSARTRRLAPPPAIS